MEKKIDCYHSILSDHRRIALAAAAGAKEEDKQKESMSLSYYYFSLGFCARRKNYHDIYSQNRPDQSLHFKGESAEQVGICWVTWGIKNLNNYYEE